jgi:hypothetical protein
MSDFPATDLKIPKQLGLGFNKINQQRFFSIVTCLQPHAARRRRLRRRLRARQHTHVIQAQRRHLVHHAHGSG